MKVTVKWTSYMKLKDAIRNEEGCSDRKTDGIIRIEGGRG